MVISPPSLRASTGPQEHADLLAESLPERFGPSAIESEIGVSSHYCRPCFALDGMGRTAYSNKLGVISSGGSPMAKKTASDHTAQEKGRHPAAPSSNTSPSRSVTSARHPPHHSPTAGRKRTSRTRGPRWSPAPDIHRLEGWQRIAAWSRRTCRKRTKSSRNTWRNISSEQKSQEDLERPWVPQVTRDAVVHFIRHWAAHRALAGPPRMVGIAKSKFSRWDRRLGTPNRHNAPIPWPPGWRTGRRAAIVVFPMKPQFRGYRRLAYMSGRRRRGCQPLQRLLRAQGRRQARPWEGSASGRGRA